jgi:succinate dehydrogenase / fumarate reductase cytochrome b subunit
LLVLAFNVEMFNILLAYFNNFIGKIIVALASLTIFYHMTNGVRHMVWDLGYGFEKPKLSSYTVLMIAFLLTLVFNILIYI